ncbi:FusB/FusC family EF-G-binding protein [Mesobacillus harenae]|uniref:FusB/FusC family EF-G-binding protein n=1 Tax=Mesobacillus harenae TaxID=2213203 RepID=UPI00158062A1|nr:FusB/FusC family EF-G-binding protein [Mesobacillus harenae]
MEPFLRNDQYNFIKSQTQILINGHSTTSDTGVIRALKAVAIDKVLNLIAEPTMEQKQVLEQIVTVKDKGDAEQFLLALSPFVIPFKSVTEQTITKLFPKSKKLKAPFLQDIDLKKISYLGWEDKGTGRKYIIAQQENKLEGLHGIFRRSSQKGICTLCNCHEDVGMFLAEIKGSEQGTFIKRGNYICQNSFICNSNITDLEKLKDFVMHLKT